MGQKCKERPQPRLSWARSNAVSSVSRQNMLTHELRKIAKNMIVLPVGLLVLFAVYFIIIVSLHNWVIVNIVVTVTSLVVSIFSLALTMIGLLAVSSGQLGRHGCPQVHIGTAH